MSMQNVHDLIPCIYLLGDRAVTGFGQKNLFGDGNPEKLAYDYSVKGADRLLVFDFSGTMDEHDRAMEAMRSICRSSQVPVIGAGNIRTMEDIEQLIYNGCDCVALNCQDEQELGLLDAAMQAYGRRRLMGCVSDFSEYSPYSRLRGRRSFRFSSTATASGRTASRRSSAVVSSREFRASM